MLQQKVVAVRAIEEVGNGVVRLRTREIPTGGAVPSAHMGGEVLAVETAIDTANPFIPGEELTITVTRGGVQ